MTGAAYKILARCLAATTMLSTPAFADVVRYSWQPIARAYYYEGQVYSSEAASNQGQAQRFRTRGLWVLFPRGSQVKLTAYDQAGRKLQAPKLDIEAAPTSLVREMPPHHEDGKEDSEDDDEDDKEGTTDKQAVDSTAPIAVAPPAEPIDPSKKRLSFIELMLAAGKESISASAGVSHFSADVGVGGTALYGRQQQENSAWFFEGLGEMHNFTTDLSEANTLGGVSVKQEKFLRIFARAGAFYDFLYRDTDTLLAAGVGVLYSRLPSLDISDPSTKEAELKNTSSIGPYAALQYQFALSASQNIGLLALYEPAVLDAGATGHAYGLQAGWRYMLAEPLFLSFGLQYRQESLVQALECGGVIDCVNKSETDIGISQGLLGFGYKF